jgi:c(7)-type cytochrome triheme protein
MPVPAAVRAIGLGLALPLAVNFWLVPAPLAAAPGDILFERSADAESAAPGASAVPPAVFPHWSHRIQYRCYVCHETPFVMKAGANEITMEKMQKGESCAICHNGAVAFPVEFQTCARCHVAPQED